MRRTRASYIMALVLWPALCQGQAAPERIPAGTRLRVRMETPVNTKTSHAGDGVDARLIQPVKIHDRIVLPVGTYLAGQVVGVRPGSHKGKVFAFLRLVFTGATLPDGRALRVEALVQDLGLLLNVDAEGVVVQEDITKGEVAADVAIGGATGAGVGGIAGAGKGAAIGAGVGATLGALGAWAETSARWDDIELKPGRKMWLRLNQDVEFAPGKPESPAPAPATLAPSKPAEPATVSTPVPAAELPTKPASGTSESATAPASPAEAVPSQPANAPSVSPVAPAASASGVDTSRTGTNSSTGPRVFLADRKAWDAAGGFTRNAPNNAVPEPRQPPVPKEEFLRAFREHCPTVVVTVRQGSADYIVLLDHGGWHSPPYRVTVLSKAGDVVYSGGTQLLRNAVKDACNALAVRK